jgi:hypothetical protein
MLRNMARRCDESRPSFASVLIDMSSASFLCRVLRDGVPSSHRAVVEKRSRDESTSAATPTASAAHVPSFVELNAFDGASAWPRLLAARSQVPVFASWRVVAPPTLLHVNPLITQVPSDRFAVALPLHARTLCVWSSRTSHRKHALFACHDFFSRLGSLELGAPAAARDAAQAEQNLSAVARRAAQLSDLAIVDLSCQDDVPSLMPTMVSRGLVLAVESRGPLTVLQVSEQQEPHERLLIDFEITSHYVSRYTSASFSHRYAALPSIFACTTDGEVDVLQARPQAVRLKRVCVVQLPRDERAVFAAPSVVSSCATVCSTKTAFAIDTRVAGGIVGEFETRLVRRWPRLPEEHPSGRVARTPHRITALASAPAPYLVATAVESFDGAYACVEMWDERYRTAPIDRWRWPTGLESMGGTVLSATGLDVHQRGNHVDACGMAPRQLVFRANEAEQRLDLFAVDGTRGRVVALHASHAPRTVPILSSESHRVPTFWDSLRHASPWCTSSSADVVHPVGGAMREQGLERESAPNIRGIAVCDVDGAGDTLSCLQLTSDGDLYRVVLSRSASPPLAAAHCVPLAPEVTEHLVAARLRRDLHRQRPRGAPIQIRPKSYETDELVPVASKRLSAKSIWRRAAQLIRQQPCSVDEIARAVDCPPDALIAALEPLVAVGKISRLAPSAAHGFSRELAKLQTVYYASLREIVLKQPTAPAATAEEPPADDDDDDNNNNEDKDDDDDDEGAIQAVLSQISQPFVDDDKLVLQARSKARTSVGREIVAKRFRRRRQFLPSAETTQRLVVDWSRHFRAQTATATGPQ